MLLLEVVLEYSSMAQGLCEILWLKRVLDELKRPIGFPIKLSALLIIQFYMTGQNTLKLIDTL